jgi:uncharacterized repeat protein (TIGR04076 family)
MNNARITVVKKAFHKDVIEEYLPHLSSVAKVCPVFEVGQTFDVEDPFGPKPDGFCSWAWADILKVVALTMMGADPTPGTEFTCCSDGLRPVTFRIQRIEG